MVMRGRCPSLAPMTLKTSPTNVIRGSRSPIGVRSKEVGVPGNRTEPPSGRRSSPWPPGQIDAQSQREHLISFGASIAIPPSLKPRTGEGFGGHSSSEGVFSRSWCHIDSSSDSISVISLTVGHGIDLIESAPRYHISSASTCCFFSWVIHHSIAYMRSCWT